MLDTDTAPAGAPPASALQLIAGELRVLLIGDAGDTEALSAAVGLSGHTLTARAATTEQALEVVAGQQVNAAILVLPFEGGTGLEFCRKLQLLAPLPILMVADQPDPRLLELCHGAGVVGCVGRSASVANLSAALTLGATWFTAAHRLRFERDELAAQNRQLIMTLENRKQIERAKGIYMRLHGLQEAEAHRRLQQESQKRRLGIADLARKIIESDELLGR